MRNRVIAACLVTIVLSRGTFRPCGPPEGVA